MDAVARTARGSRVCTGCGAELGPSALACPACGALVHAEDLKRLASEAEASAARGDPSAALAAWRSTLDLLPPNTRQHAQIAARVLELSRAIDAAPKQAKPSSARSKWIAGGGAALLFLVTKGKFLLLGLTKMSTLFSLFLSLGVYWTAFGWKFAAGLIASLYVHEIGHVASLARYGIKASAPMFVPGLGALVRLKQYPADAREDARVGLAGPLWGLGASIAFLAAGLWGEWAICLSIAHVGAWINLFNLLPVWQLDGSRGFRALSRAQRWFAVASVGAAYAMSGDGILVLLLLVAGWRALAKEAPLEGDRRAAIEYAVLVILLTGVTKVVLTIAPPGSLPFVE